MHIDYGNGEREIYQPICQGPSRSGPQSCKWIVYTSEHRIESNRRATYDDKQRLMW